MDAVTVARSPQRRRGEEAEEEEVVAGRRRRPSQTPRPHPARAPPTVSNWRAGLGVQHEVAVTTEWMEKTFIRGCSVF